MGAFTSAFGQTYYIALKMDDYNQTSDSTPTQGTSFSFQAVETTYTYTSITGPGGDDSISSVPGNGGGKYKYTSSTYTTQADLDSAYPDSTPDTPSTYYTFNPGGPSNALAGDEYPTAPQLTFVNSATPTFTGSNLILDPTIDNTLTWTAYSGTNTEGYNYSTGGFEQFKVTGGSVDDRQTALGPDSQASFDTYDITADSLAANSTYSLDIQYFLADFGSGTSTFSGAGYETDDLITIQTIPEPQTNQLLVAGGGLLLFGLRRYLFPCRRENSASV